MSRGGLNGQRGSMIAIRMARRIWHAPGLMWGASIVTRLAGLALLLPVALRVLPPAEAGLWFLLSTLISLLSLADFGFGQTFIRAVAYTRASEGGMAPAERTAVLATMRHIYDRIGLGVLLIGGTLGTLALLRPVAATQAPGMSWVCWGFVLSVAAVHIRCGMYAAYLQGVERIAPFRRWELLSSAGSILAALVALGAGAGLVGLVLTFHAGLLVNALVNRHLACSGPDRQRWRALARRDPETWLRVWPAAWRSGLGVLMMFGTVQASGLFYAQVGAVGQVAAYLLALRLVDALMMIARVPFYVQIPGFARLFAAGHEGELVSRARSAMALSAWAFALGSLTLGLAGPQAVALIGSETPFVSPPVWWTLALANMLMLAGAMHIQLYTVTNHVVWHISNGISGTVMLALMPPFFAALGLVGLPLATLTGVAVFYLPYAATKARRRFRMAFGIRDVVGWVTPALILGALLAVSVGTQGHW